MKIPTCQPSIMQQTLRSFFLKNAFAFQTMQGSQVVKIFTGAHKRASVPERKLFLPILSLGRIKSDFMIKMAFRKEFLIARLMHYYFLSNFLRSYIYYCLFDFCHKNHMLVCQFQRQGLSQIIPLFQHLLIDYPKQA